MSDYSTRPAELHGPPDTTPRLFRFRLWWAERFGSRDAAATLRWRANNDKPAVCDCGAPGTVRVTAAGGGFAGSSPPYWWRCDEHKGVDLGVPWANGRPLINQTRDECSWQSAKIGEPIEACGCGTHLGDPMRRGTPFVPESDR